MTVDIWAVPLGTTFSLYFRLVLPSGNPFFSVLAMPMSEVTGVWPCFNSSVNMCLQLAQYVYYFVD